MSRRRLVGELRVCQQCGSKYITGFGHSNGRFCSRKCRSRAELGIDHFSNESRNCVVCGKSYIIVRRDQETCGDLTCRMRHRHNSCKITIGNCVQCGRLFVSGKTGEQKRFCSDYCRGKARRENIKNDPVLKVDRAISISIHHSLKSQGLSKRSSGWESVVGYTKQQLKEHLESLFTDGMSWDNYGEWHIDHRIPKSWFNITSVRSKAFRRCWALDNLQPMWAYDNLSKNNKHFA